jgi:hypothetical protein
MQKLSQYYVAKVYGGNVAPAEAMSNACKGMPDSAKVTFETSVGSSLGINSTSSQASNKLTIETTCGDLKKSGAGSKPPSGSGTGGGRTSSGNVTPPAQQLIVERPWDNPLWSCSRYHNAMIRMPR